jgi:tetraacyldisaccharide 4'-kinase
MRPRSLRRRVEATWYGKSRAALVLAPLAWLYGGLVGLRRSAYRLGILRIHRLPVPVIVVGNISVGGTGKTPVVAWLVGEALAMGFRPGIVSRGYGSSAGRGPRLVTPADTAVAVGDEPLLLARTTGVPVCVGTDRVAGARALVAADCNLVVADDGLQHLGLGRDVEVAVVDGARLAGNARLLPAGPLREPWSRLGHVDLVLVNGSLAREDEVQWPDPGRCHRFELEPGDVDPLAGGSSRPLASFAGQRVYALAGIGNPERFRNMLAAHGLQPELLAVDDHGRASPEDLARACDAPLLMTAKDAVKYAASDRPPGAGWWQVKVHIAAPAPARAAVASLLRRCQGASDPS